MTEEQRLAKYISDPSHYTNDERSEDGPFPPLAPQRYDQDFFAGTLRRIHDPRPAPLAWVDSVAFAGVAAIVILSAFAFWAVGTFW